MTRARKLRREDTETTTVVCGRSLWLLYNSSIRLFSEQKMTQEGFRVEEEQRYEYLHVVVWVHSGGRHAGDNISDTLNRQDSKNINDSTTLTEDNTFKTCFR